MNHGLERPDIYEYLVSNLMDTMTIWKPIKVDEMINASKVVTTNHKLNFGIKISTTDIVAVINIKTCRLLKMSGKVWDQLSTGDLVWFLSVQEWQDYVKSVLETHESRARHGKKLPFRTPAVLKPQQLKEMVESKFPSEKIEKMKNLLVNVKLKSPIKSISPVKRRSTIVHKVSETKKSKSNKLKENSNHLELHEDSNGEMKETQQGEQTDNESIDIVIEQLQSVSNLLKHTKLDSSIPSFNLEEVDSKRDHDTDMIDLNQIPLRTNIPDNSDKKYNLEHDLVSLKNKMNSPQHQKTVEIISAEDVKESDLNSSSNEKDISTEKIEKPSNAKISSTYSGKSLVKRISVLDDDISSDSSSNTSEGKNVWEELTNKNKIEDIDNQNKSLDDHSNNLEKANWQGKIDYRYQKENENLEIIPQHYSNEIENVELESISNFVSTYPHNDSVPSPLQLIKKLDDQQLEVKTDISIKTEDSNLDIEKTNNFADPHVESIILNEQESELETNDLVDIDNVTQPQMESIILNEQESELETDELVKTEDSNLDIEKTNNFAEPHVESIILNEQESELETNKLVNTEDSEDSYLDIEETNNFAEPHVETIVLNEQESELETNELVNTEDSNLDVKKTDNFAEPHVETIVLNEQESELETNELVNTEDSNLDVKKTDNFAKPHVETIILNEQESELETNELVNTEDSYLDIEKTNNFAEPHVETIVLNEQESELETNELVNTEDSNLDVKKTDNFAEPHVETIVLNEQESELETNELVNTEDSNLDVKKTDNFAKPHVETIILNEQESELETNELVNTEDSYLDIEKTNNFAEPHVETIVLNEQESELETNELVNTEDSNLDVKKTDNFAKPHVETIILNEQESELETNELVNTEDSYLDIEKTNNFAEPHVETIVLNEQESELETNELVNTEDSYLDVKKTDNFAEPHVETIVLNKQESELETNELVNTEDSNLDVKKTDNFAKPHVESIILNEQESELEANELVNTEDSNLDVERTGNVVNGNIDNTKLHRRLRDQANELAEAKKVRETLEARLDETRSLLNMFVGSQIVKNIGTSPTVSQNDLYLLEDTIKDITVETIDENSSNPAINSKLKKSLRKLTEKKRLKEFKKVKEDISSDSSDLVDIQEKVKKSKAIISHPRNEANNNRIKDCKEVPTYGDNFEVSATVRKIVEPTPTVELHIPQIESTTSFDNDDNNLAEMDDIATDLKPLITHVEPNKSFISIVGESRDDCESSDLSYASMSNYRIRDAPKKHLLCNKPVQIPTKSSIQNEFDKLEDVAEQHSKDSTEISSRNLSIDVEDNFAEVRLPLSTQRPDLFENSNPNSPVRFPRTDINSDGVICDDRSISSLRKSRSIDGETAPYAYNYPQYHSDHPEFFIDSPTSPLMYHDEKKRILISKSFDFKRLESTETNEVSVEDHHDRKIHPTNSLSSIPTSDIAKDYIVHTNYANKSFSKDDLIENESYVAALQEYIEKSSNSGDGNSTGKLMENSLHKSFGQHVNSSIKKYDLDPNNSSPITRVSTLTNNSKPEEDTAEEKVVEDLTETFLHGSRFHVKDLLEREEPEINNKMKTSYLNNAIEDKQGSTFQDKSSFTKENIFSDSISEITNTKDDYEDFHEKSLLEISPSKNELNSVTNDITQKMEDEKNLSKPSEVFSPSSNVESTNADANEYKTTTERNVSDEDSDVLKPMKIFMKQFLITTKFLNDSNLRGLKICKNFMNYWNETEIICFAVFQLYGTVDGVIVKGIKTMQILRALKDADIVGAITTSQLDLLLTKINSRNQNNYKATSKNSAMKISNKSSTSSKSNITKTGSIQKNSSKHDSNSLLSSFPVFMELLTVIACKIFSKDMKVRKKIKSKGIVLGDFDKGNDAYESNNKSEILECMYQLTEYWKNILQNHSYHEYESIIIESKMNFCGILLKLPYQSHYTNDTMIEYKKCKFKIKGMKQLNENDIEQIKLIWERNNDQIRQIFSYYAKNTDIRRLGITPMKLSLNFNSCKEFLTDFQLLPQIIDAHEFIRLFRICILWQLQYGDDMIKKDCNSNGINDDQSIDTNLHNNLNDIDRMISIETKKDFSNSNNKIKELKNTNSMYSMLSRPSTMISMTSNDDPMDFKASIGSLNLLFSGFLELITRISLYKQKLGRNSSQSLENLMRIMDASGGKAKLVKSSRNSISVRHFTYNAKKK